jgi:ATPase family associated with various cellular activities (AAA)
MASHPAITPFSLDFSHECLSNESLTEFLGMAAQHAPSLVIFEDLDRAFAGKDDKEKLSKITLPHFLNCLDGVGTTDGLIVVATANDPSRMDGALSSVPADLTGSFLFSSSRPATCVWTTSVVSAGEHSVWRNCTLPQWKRMDFRSRN